MEATNETLQSETYFTLINVSRSPMKQGTQAWTTYGKRTSTFLMENYAFCFKDNLYDSYIFHVKMNLENSENSITVQNILAPEAQEDYI